MGTVIHGDRGSGGTGTGWDGQVEFRADLPITLIVPPIGSVYLVEKPTKILGITIYQSGLYMKDADTGSLSDWRRLNIAVTYYNSDGSLAGDRVISGTTSRYSVTHDELGGWAINVQGAGPTGDVVSYSIGLAGASWDRTGLSEGSGFVMNLSTSEPQLEFKQGIGGGSPWTSILKAVTMTAARLWELPNKSGIIGLANDNEIIVKSSSDLPAPVGDAITIPDNTSLVFNTFLTTANRFILGNNVKIKTVNDRKDGINYTGVGVLFTVVDASVTIQDMNINAPTGTLINATNVAKDKPIRIVSNHTGNVSDWGFVDGFSNVIIEENGFANYGQGAIVKNYSRMFWNDNKIFAWKQEVGAIMLTLEGTCGETIIGINVFHPETNETAFEIDAAATVSSLTIAGNSFVGELSGGTYLGPDISTDLENTAYTIIANSGVAEASDIVAGIEIQTTTPALTDVLDGTYVVIAGTTTESNGFRFTQSANMTAQCNTSQAIQKTIEVKFLGTKDAGADREYDFAIFKNGSILSESEITNITLNASGAVSFSTSTLEELAPTDTIDVRVSGAGTADDATIEAHIIIS